MRSAADESWAVLILAAIPTMFIFVLLLLGGCGYIHNIINVYEYHSVLTGKVILQIAGIFFPPLGAILGWL
jgi:hypothetical protein